jgi:hypothetical protein
MRYSQRLCKLLQIATNTLERISMKTQIRALTIAVGLLCAASGFAQTAATNTVNAATTAATTAVNTAKTSASAAVAAKVNPPAAAPVAAPAAAPVKMAAGGAGKVWVNASSKTYHCEGSKFYGKTKTGEYMSEADAKSKGNHAVKGKACAK